MKAPRTAYELSQSQVSTPPEVVELFWEVVQNRRSSLNRVLDLGAGDCRFARGGHYREYVGIEIDPARAKAARIPANARIHCACAFKHQDGDYDACIGNPPYVRHHEIERPWRDRIADWVYHCLSIRLNKKCNLYLYFLCLGLIKTRSDGIVAMLLPFEWVSRPSADPLRRHVQENKWRVDVYRFRDPIFPDVLTTASITVVDKGESSGRWSYFDIGSTLSIQPRNGVTEHSRGALEYADRGPLWAMRGLSPGSQAIFCLTEGERIHLGLKKSDVAPCVTTLKHVPRELRSLTPSTFNRHFVNAGERCWLINSWKSRRSSVLNAYLASIPEHARDNYTCRDRDPWFRFKPHPIPKLLVSSGFTEFGPKVLVNSVQAHAVGSVCGIHSDARVSARQVQVYLLDIDFEKVIVPHAKTLKKVEVRQLNAALNDVYRRMVAHAKRCS
jgi:hypothetical protein